MVVDDEADVLSVVCLVLERCGNLSCTVTGHTNPLSAIAEFKQHPSSFDMVLTDIRMPGMMGFDLAKEIKEIRPDIKVAFMSAFEVDEKMPGYPGALKKEDILRKPGDLLDLCKSLEKYLISSP